MHGLLVLDFLKDADERACARRRNSGHGPLNAACLPILVASALQLATRPSLLAPAVANAISSESEKSCRYVCRGQLEYK